MSSISPTDQSRAPAISAARWRCDAGGVYVSAFAQDQEAPSTGQTLRPLCAQAAGRRRHCADRSARGLAAAQSPGRPRRRHRGCCWIRTGAIWSTRSSSTRRRTRLDVSPMLSGQSGRFETSDSVLRLRRGSSVRRHAGSLLGDLPPDAEIAALRRRDHLLQHHDGGHSGRGDAGAGAVADRQRANPQAAARIWSGRRRLLGMADPLRRCRSASRATKSAR